MANTIPGVFCLEAEWQADLGSPDTVRPVLDFFATTTADKPIPLVYRQVLSKVDIALCVKRWRRSKYQRLQIVYFASHGKPGKLDLWNDEVITIEEIATLLRGACEGKSVLFGSCCTLKVSEQRIAAFLKTTGARCVAGYVKSPDWAGSTALDLIVMETIRQYRSPSRARKWLQENCQGLLDLYGFRMHTA